ncbi:hypothetical protein [Streptomyces cinnamoneus]|uniref:hypothetical protein n=1 Tax=Streptomyces cinnamoneus TaxID=53446 RepID=UPI001E34189D|nr:hypothetical protein [Streptomyces cinnamoneus]
MLHRLVEVPLEAGGLGQPVERLATRPDDGLRRLDEAVASLHGARYAAHDLLGAGEAGVAPGAVLPAVAELREDLGLELWWAGLPSYQPMWRWWIALRLWHIEP